MGKLLRLVQIYHVRRWMGGKKHVELNFFWPAGSLVMRLLVLSLVSLYFASDEPFLKVLLSKVLFGHWLVLQVFSVCTHNHFTRPFSEELLFVC